MSITHILTSELNFNVSQPSLLSSHTADLKLVADMPASIGHRFLGEGFPGESHAGISRRHQVPAHPDKHLRDF